MADGRSPFFDRFVNFYNIKRRRWENAHIGGNGAGTGISLF